jgi:ketosteroid isomerase-like protein
MLSVEVAEAFVKEWIDAWNSRDLERILHHWDDDCVFSSPLVARLFDEPSGRVRGKAALRAYWTVGLEKNPDLRFELDAVHVGADSVVIAYRNHRGQRCAEMLRLGAHGRAVEGHAHYAG